MSMRGHFYFSQKQSKLYDYSVTMCRLDTGGIVEYTEMSIRPMPEPYNWDDMVYLGKGVVYSVDGVVQS